MFLFKKALWLVMMAGIGSFAEQIFITSWQMQDNANVGGKTGAELSSASFSPTGWYKATVPGTVVQTYLDQKAPGFTTDINVGKNAFSMPDLAVAQKSFWYYAKFTVPQSYSGKNIWLDFDGINPQADIFLNGKSVGSMKGAFKRGKFKVTGIAAVGDNYCAVKIYPQWGAPKYAVKSLDYCGDMGGFQGPVFLCAGGWDWMPTIPDRDIGIWNEVYIRESGPVIIREPWIKTTLPLPATNSADITLSVKVINVTGSPVTGTLKGVIGGTIQFEKAVSLAASDTQTVIFNPTTTPALKMNNPKLWFPCGYGDPNMYACNLSFVTGTNAISDSTQFRFGVRQFSYERRGDLGLVIKVNGRRVLCKGGNWGIDDMLKRVNEPSLRAKVKYHREMNFNMIRNWVGMTDDEVFYDLCDENGLLLWDEFWMAHENNGPPPADPVLWLDNAKDKILRYRNHACIALWCARNESDPPDNIHIPLKKMVDSTLDGTRIYLATSGHGDAHSGGPWCWVQPESYTGRMYGFTTEIGTATVPSYESMKLFLTPSAEWPINETWIFHDYCNWNGNPAAYTAALEERYGKASGLEDYCRKAQLLNVETLRALYESLNSNMWWKATGTLLWMSNPAWPSVMWQTYDYYLDPTGAYYGIKHACEPVHVQMQYTGRRVQVINCTNVPLNSAKIETRIYDISGALKSSTTNTVNAKADTVSPAFDVTLPAGISQTFFLKLDLFNSTGAPLSSNFYWLPAVQNDMTAMQTMAKATLVVSNAVFIKGAVKDSVILTIKNTGAPVAVGTRVKLLRYNSLTRVLPAYYSDNYFCLAPGDSQRVTVEFDDADLKGENPRLFLEAYNMVSRQINLVTTIADNRALHKSSTGLCASFSSGRLLLQNVPAGSAWSVSLYTIAGREVAKKRGIGTGGNVDVSAKKLIKGMYIAKIEASGQILTRIIHK